MPEIQPSEERYKQIIDRLPLGVALMDSRGGVLYTNPLITKLFGPTEKDPFKYPLWEIIGVSDETYINEGPSRRLFEVESRFGPVWFRFQAVSSPQHEETNQTVVVVEDITPEVRAKGSARHEIGNKLTVVKGYADMNSVGVEKIRRSGIAASPSFNEVEVYSKRLADSARIIKELGDMVRPPMRYGFVRWLPSDVEEGMKYVMTVDRGNPVDRINYYDLFNDIPYGLGRIDASGRIIETNSEMAQLFGRGRERLVGLPIIELLSIASQEQEGVFNAGWFEEVKKGILKEYNAEIPFLGGWTHFTVVRGNGLGHHELTIMAKDTTDQADAVSRILSQFELELIDIDKYSNVVLAAIGKAKDEIGEPASELARPESIVLKLRNSLEALGIVAARELNYPLDPEKIRKSPVDFDKFLLKLIENNRLYYAGEGVSLEGDIPANLPTILADRMQLGKAFDNLLKNAFEANIERIQQLAKRGEGEDSISKIVVKAIKVIPAEKKYGFIEVTVEDTGVGIPEEIREHIGKRRGTSSKAEKSVVERGIGTYDTRRAIESHGIEVGGEKIPGTLSFYSVTENEIRRREQNIGERWILGKRHPGTIAVVRLPFKTD